MDSSKSQESVPGIDDETKKQLKVVRKELWIGAIRGLAFGTLVGFVGHKAINVINSNTKKKLLSKNSLMLSTIVCGAICSYIGAVVDGSNSFAYVTDILKWKRRAISDNLRLDGNKEELSVELDTEKKSYGSLLRQNEKEIISNLDDAFDRRAEAIRYRKTKDNDR